MSERGEIYDILYAEVMAGSRALEKAKGAGSNQVREAARAALEKAVQRYTDFSMEGKIPADLEIRIKASSASPE
jgi:hypothetical protein